MGFIVVIPARFASTRLPGKMLLSLANKPMIQHVYERACDSGAERVIVATDHQDIFDAVKKFSGEVVLTSQEHRSGTERIAEVVKTLSFDDQSIVVNVQGDEPLIEPEIINSVAENLMINQQASIATVSTPINSMEDLVNPNVVKVVMDENKYAMYFSRAPIPWPRDMFSGKDLSTIAKEDISQLGVTFYRHIGIYAYRAEFIKTYVDLPQNALEQTEALEQLRALSNGFRISMHVSKLNSAMGIDTQEDYDKVKEIIER